MADAALDSAAARFLFHFAVAGALNITDERRAQNSCDPIFADDAAEFVRRDAEQGEIEQARLSRELVFFNRNPGQCGGAGGKKGEQKRVFGKELLFALFFLFRFLPVFLDRKIEILIPVLNIWLLHIIESKSCSALRV